MLRRHSHARPLAPNNPTSRKEPPFGIPTAHSKTSPPRGGEEEARKGNSPAGRGTRRSEQDERAYGGIGGESGSGDGRSRPGGTLQDFFQCPSIASAVRLCLVAGHFHPNANASASS
ncbi:hypothetical protein NL676_021901 [Syzygium grande]|nr:hypothetical protein NL676_021901 [Syzygium grande]